MAYFVCRLNAPRRSFPADATPEELHLMRQHAAYWTGQWDPRKLIVFGPVADPKGAWGLAVVEADEIGQVQRFAAADPVVTSGQGFFYDIMPMLPALVRP